ncbi:alpha/beta fold hydrolase [Solimonas marina]|nr:alpha/beta hydrolase [Solimonas marina]
MRMMCRLAALLWLAVAPLAHADALPDGRTIKVFGTDIHYYEMGSGPTVVLVHGLGSSAFGDWHAVMPKLAKDHHVVALDQLGFGASSKPMVDYSIQLWVDTLGEFLREKQIHDFTLIGESLGGWISAKYTIQALQGIAADPAFALPKPSRLVLCDAAGRRSTFAQLFAPRPANVKMPPMLSLAGQKATIGAVFYRAQQHASAQDIRDGLAWALGKDDGWTVHSVTTNPALLDEAVDGQLDAIRIPTLLLWGAHDGLVPVADGRWYAAGIAGSQLKLIADSAHVPMTEQPDAWLAALRPFLDHSAAP